jgi:hypothetical protein
MHGAYGSFCHKADISRLSSNVRYWGVKRREAYLRFCADKRHPSISIRSRAVLIILAKYAPVYGSLGADYHRGNGNGVTTKY